MTPPPIQIGMRLKQARLAKNLSLEKVVAQTKLAKSVVLMLEADQFDRFPAPLYVMGFIQNLSEVVGLDPKPLLEEYKVWLRDRSPQAVPETTPPPPPLDEEGDIPPPPKADPSTPAKPFKLPGTPLLRAWVLVALGLVAVSLVIWIVVRSWGRESQTVITNNNEVLKTHTYRMYGEKSSYDLNSGDTVRVFVGDSVKLYTLTSISPEQITFTLDFKSHSLQPDQSIQVDTGGDTANDLEIKLKRISGDKAIVAFTVLNYREDKVDYGSIWTNQEHVTVGREYVLFAQQEKMPIQVYVRAATQPSHLSYNVDSRRENTATLQTGAATVIRAEDSVEIQIGNFRSVELIVNKIPLNLSTRSEKFSITKIIKWVPDPNNETRFDLVIKDTAN